MSRRSDRERTHPAKSAVSCEVLKTVSGATLVSDATSTQPFMGRPQLLCGYLGGSYVIAALHCSLPLTRSTFAVHNGKYSMILANKKR